MYVYIYTVYLFLIYVFIYIHRHMPIDCSTSYHMQLLQPIKCGRTPPSVRVDHHLMVRVGTGSLQFVLLESPSPKTNVAMENAHVYAGMKLWDGPCSSQVFYFYFFLRGCSLSVGNRHDNFGCFNVITFICCLSYMLCRFFFLEKEQLECRMFLNASNEKHETWGSTVGVLGFFCFGAKNMESPTSHCEFGTSTKPSGVPGVFVWQ